MQKIALLLIGIFAAFALCNARAAETRTPWTTSHVRGTPEPPPPFETQRVFPRLTFEKPLDIAFAPGSKRIFVAQEKGKIYSFLPNDPEIKQADLFFDSAQIPNLDKIPDCKGVENVLALTFHPKFEQNRYCYIQYNLQPKVRKRNFPNGARISRFVVPDTDPPKVDISSEVILIEWLAGGHNGCTLKFGPDGMLYFSAGDAADPDPPDDLNTGQDLSDLLSSILRIDVDHPDKGRQYSIPADNPFVKTPGARGEIYAYGFRNPFRMSFDSKTGNLWAGDVGWELWETAHCVKPGGNYGWSIVEALNPVHPDGKRGPTEIIKPQAAVFHTDGSSMTGGIVYRGTKLPALSGQYIFGDWQTGRIWSAKCIGPKEDNLEPYHEIAQTDHRLVCFAEEPDHELLILDHGGGGLFRLIPNPEASVKSNFPHKLSETGLFSSVKDQTPAPGVQPFTINAPQWLDGAVAERWIAIPNDLKAYWGKGVWGDDKPFYPKNTVLVRTITLPKAPTSPKHVETQLLHYDGRQWHAYSYAWNDSQDDAELVPASGAEHPYMVGDATAKDGARRQNWHYASRTQCMTCHNVWCDYALAFNAPQLDRMAKLTPEGPERNQLQAFRELGLLHEPHVEPPPKRKPNQPPPPPPEKIALTNPYDAAGNLNERARSYLHVNCSQCHRFGGGGTALIDVRKEQHREELKAIDQRPLLGDFGLEGARLICTGDPARSVLLYRTSKLGRGRMPHIGSELVDVDGVRMLEQWIQSLGAPPKDEPARTLASLRAEEAILEAPDHGTLDDRVAAADRLLGSTSGALILLSGIQSGKIPADIRALALAKAIDAKNEPVKDLFRRFDPRDQSANRLGLNFDAEKLLAMKGAAERGRKVFMEAGTIGGKAGVCVSCHKLEGKGVAFGPDLSHIGTKYNKAQLLESIVQPSKTIAEGYTNFLVKKKDGEILMGIIAEKSNSDMLLKSTDKEYRIQMSDVQKMAAQPISPMPEGLLQDMSAEDAADLLEYLFSLK